MEFMSGTLSDDRSIKMLNIIDNYNSNIDVDQLSALAEGDSIY